MVLKEEIASLRKTGKDRQVEVLKLVTRLVKLDEKRRKPVVSELIVRTMKLPSGDCSSSLAMVGSGGQLLVDQENNRRGKPGGSNSGEIEVVGGYGCARLENLRRIGRGGSNGGIIEVIEGGDCARLKKLRRVGGGGGVGGSNNNCSREGDNNVVKNIVIKTAERDSRNMCSLRRAQDGYILANDPKSQNTLGALSIGMSSS